MIDDLKWSKLGCDQRLARKRGGVVLTGTHCVYIYNVALVKYTLQGVKCEYFKLCFNPLELTVLEIMKG